MPFDLCVFGHRLRTIRKDRGLSQSQLADVLGAAHGWISEIENARQTHIQADTVYRFCEALQVSADYLMGLCDVPGRMIAERTTILPRRKRATAAGGAP